jgi:hypothetical protein
VQNARIQVERDRSLADLPLAILPAVLAAVGLYRNNHSD